MIINHTSKQENVIDNLCVNLYQYELWYSIYTAHAEVYHNNSYLKLKESFES